MKSKPSRASFRAWLNHQNIDGKIANRILSALYDADDYAFIHYRHMPMLFDNNNADEGMNLINDIINDKGFISDYKMSAYTIKSIGIHYYAAYIKMIEKQKIKKKRKQDIVEQSSLSISDYYGLENWNYAKVSIDVLPFSIRTSNVLKRNEIFTLSDFLNKSYNDLRTFNGLGLTAIKEIDVILAQMQSERVIPCKDFFKDIDSIIVQRIINKYGLNYDNTGLTPFIIKVLNDFKQAEITLGDNLAKLCLSKPVYCNVIIDTLKQFTEEVYSE